MQQKIATETEEIPDINVPKIFWYGGINWNDSEGDKYGFCEFQEYIFFRLLYISLMRAHILFPIF